MKSKFIIVSLIEGGWYMTTDSDGVPIFDNDPEPAELYDKYEDAQEQISKLPKGIYQIDKIFIVE